MSKTWKQKNKTCRQVLRTDLELYQDNFDYIKISHYCLGKWWRIFLGVYYTPFVGMKLDTGLGTNSLVTYCNVRKAILSQLGTFPSQVFAFTSKNVLIGRQKERWMDQVCAELSTLCPQHGVISVYFVIKTINIRKLGLQLFLTSYLQMIQKCC